MRSRMKITRTIPMMDVVVLVYDKDVQRIDRRDFSLIDGTDVEKFIAQFDDCKYIEHNVCGRYENKLVITLDEFGYVYDYSFKTITDENESEVE